MWMQRTQHTQHTQHTHTHTRIINIHDASNVLVLNPIDDLAIVLAIVEPLERGDSVDNS